MTSVPAILPGHWESAEGAEIAREYAARQRTDLCMGDKTDLGLANAVFLTDRNSLSLLPLQTAAKERIRWLSVQLAIALELVETAHGVLAEPSDVPGSEEWFAAAEGLLARARTAGGRSGA